MDKILIIADDLTGALDSGVAFADAGISTCVGEGEFFSTNADAKNCAVQVTVVPTRHMPKEDAYRAVYDVTKTAKVCGIRYILKKVDSALRGNVGAELAASLAATGEKTLYFVPAFPKMKRVTRNGIQYIDGDIPVAESVFRQDPFNPVRHSAVADVIAETTSVTAYPGGLNREDYPAGIAVFDAQTDEDIQKIAAHLFHDLCASLVAGCAGLAAAIPAVLRFPKTAEDGIAVPLKLITFCGSVNPISIRQCQEAETCGAPRFHLIRNGVPEAEEHLAKRVAAASADSAITILDTGSTDVGDGAEATAENSRRVAEKMGAVIGRVSRLAPDATLFIIGGDTLIAFIHYLGIKTIIPAAELMPGVVLAKYRFEGAWRYLISKSGGFGEPDLLRRVFLKLPLLAQEAEDGGETVPE